VRRGELERIWPRLSHLSEDDRDVVEAFSKQFLNKLLHDPMERLKEGVGNGRGVEFVEAVRYLHDLEVVEAEHSDGSGAGDAELEGIDPEVPPGDDE